MKRVALLALVGLALIPGSVPAKVTVPSVYRTKAEFFAARYMRHIAPTWQFRDSGSINCAKGRINRTSWRCRVRWTHGTRCQVGRVRVYGERFDDKGRALYGMDGAFRRC